MPISNHKFQNHHKDNIPGGLYLSGPIIKITIDIPQILKDELKAAGKKIPKTIKGLALIDTGATKTAVDYTIAKSLGINPIGTIDSRTASGITTLPLFPAQIIFPTLKWSFDFSSVTGIELNEFEYENQKVIALIGRDILMHAVFIYNGTEGSYSLAF